MSDRATTCHILSIQTRTCSSKAAPTLVTLTHLDGDIYTDCIIEIIRRHLHHHTTKTRSRDKLILVVDVVVGGFDDARGSSIKISFWLMHLLAFVAERFRDRITITLRTCAISCLNDNGLQSPLGLGMGIDMKTGDVFWHRQTLPLRQQCNYEMHGYGREVAAVDCQWSTATPVIA